MYVGLVSTMRNKPSMRVFVLSLDFRFISGVLSPETFYLTFASSGPGPIFGYGPKKG
jgi:hypothetical protein